MQGEREREYKVWSEDDREKVMRARNSKIQRCKQTYFLRICSFLVSFIVFLAVFFEEKLLNYIKKDIHTLNLSESCHRRRVIVLRLVLYFSRDERRLNSSLLGLSLAKNCRHIDLIFPRL